MQSSLSEEHSMLGSMLILVCTLTLWKSALLALITFWCTPSGKLHYKSLLFLVHYVDIIIHSLTLWEIVLLVQLNLCMYQFTSSPLRTSVTHFKHYIMQQRKRTFLLAIMFDCILLPYCHVLYYICFNHVSYACVHFICSQGK